MARGNGVAEQNSNWRGGIVAHPLYRIWRSMIDRCENSNHRWYHRYGGRGIQVCESWRTSFQNFVADMGERPEGKGPTGRSLWSLDRKDNSGDYTPENCHWALQSSQNLNRDEWDKSNRSKGREIWTAKLDEQAILDIRRASDRGETRAFLATIHGVDAGTISRIATRKSWSWLPEETEN